MFKSYVKLPEGIINDPREKVPTKNRTPWPISAQGCRRCSWVVAKVAGKELAKHVGLSRRPMTQTKKVVGKGLLVAHPRMSPNFGAWLSEVCIRPNLYPLENSHSSKKCPIDSWLPPFKLLIVHSYVNVYQRLSTHFRGRLQASQSPARGDLFGARRLHWKSWAGSKEAADRWIVAWGGKDQPVLTVGSWQW